MIRHAISHERLMRESTDRVQLALTSSDANEQMWHAASWRIPRSGRNGMRTFESDAPAGELFRAAGSVAALKHATFRLVHGKALFQYLRAARCGGGAHAGHGALSPRPQL